MVSGEETPERREPAAAESSGDLGTESGDDAGAELRGKRRSRRWLALRLRRWMRFGRKAMQALLVGCGWIAFAGVWLIFVAYPSGALQTWIAVQVSAQLGEELGPLRIDGLAIDPLTRHITLRGVQLGSHGQVDEIELLLTAQFPPRLSRVALRGGRLLLSPALLQALNGLAPDAQAGAARDTEAGGLAEDFELSLEGLQLAWSPAARRAPLPIGIMDLRLYSPKPGAHTIEATIQTTACLGEPIRLRAEHAAGDDRWRLVLGARELSLTRPELPRGALRDLWAAHELEGRADLDLQIDLDASSGLLHQLDVRLRMHDGRVRLAHVQQEEYAHLQAAGLALDISLAQRPGQESTVWTFDELLENPRALQVDCRAQATWRERTIGVVARYGAAAAPGLRLDGWLQVDDLPLGEELGILVGSAPVIEELRATYATDGSAAIRVGLKVEQRDVYGDDWIQALGFALLIDPSGTASAAYRGSPNRQAVQDQPGVTPPRNLGFPLRIANIRGSLTYVLAMDQPRVASLGLFGLAGDHGSGEVLIDGSLIALSEWVLPADQKHLVKYDFYLHASSPSLAIDERMRRSFEGLAGVIPPEELWLEYRPSAGRLGFDLQLWTNDVMPGMAVDATVNLAEAELSWRALPLQLTRVEGPVRILYDGQARASRNGAQDHAPPTRKGKGQTGFSFDISADCPAMRERLHLAGHLQTDPDHSSLLADNPGLRMVEYMRVSVSGVNTRSQHLRDVLPEIAPEAAIFLNDWQIAGFADASAVRARPSATSAALTRLAFQPCGPGLELQPKVFPMRTTGVEGRVYLSILEPPVTNGDVPEPQMHLTIAPILGRWSNAGRENPIAVHGTIDDDKMDLLLFGNGIDTANKALVRSLEVAIGEGGTQVSLHDHEARGQLDLSARIRSHPDGTADFKTYLHARGIEIGPPGATVLENIEGSVIYSNGSVRADDLRAVFAGTPVRFRRFYLREVPEGLRLTTRIKLKGARLGGRSLAWVLPPETLELLERAQWRGQVDIPDATLDILLREGQEPELSFDGDAELTGLSLDTGSKVELRRASIQGLHLEREGGQWRGWARAQNIVASFDGRELSEANLVLGYHHPFITIEQFEGRFEGGMLRSPDSVGSSFAALSLEHPYGFSLAAEAIDLSLAGLLKGLFNSDFANQGTLSGLLRLRGELSHPSRLTGTGHARLKNSNLGSIPVFQAVLSQLGFDTTATFDEMSCKLDLHEGRIFMSEMVAASPLLRVVGQGTAYMDGRLDHELEVRYSLLDKLGPLTLLLYKIQNSLLRISIGGDLARPRVQLQGLLARLLTFSSSDKQRLPLPGLSPLPVRF